MDVENISGVRNHRPQGRENIKSQPDRTRILIAEDSTTEAQYLRGILEEAGYEVSLAVNGKEGLASLPSFNPSLIISDIIMPEMDGYEFCQKVKSAEEFKDVPFLILTGLTEPSNVARGLQCGADHFITKPYDPQFLISRVQSVIANRELRKYQTMDLGIKIIFGGQQYLITSDRLQILDFLLSTYETAVQQNKELRKVQCDLNELNKNLEARVEERTADLLEEINVRKIAERKLKESEDRIKKGYDNLQQTYWGIIKVISAMVELRDPYTAGHQVRVARLSKAIAEEMGFGKERVEQIYTVAHLHDVGKISLPAEILAKPGTLNAVELSLIRAHSRSGYDILKNIDFFYPAADWVLEHHERLDGSGYPCGLSGDDIAMESRIIAVADVVEAMASYRPYRPSLGIDAALEEITNKKGTLFDGEVVDACLRIFQDGEFHLNNENSEDNRYLWHLADT